MSRITNGGPERARKFSFGGERGEIVQTQNNYDNKNSLSLKNLLSTFFHQLEIVHVFRLCVRTGVIIFFCVCGK